MSEINEQKSVNKTEKEKGSMLKMRKRERERERKDLIGGVFPPKVRVENERVNKEISERKSMN